MSEISVCIITKNESKNISKCLEAIKGYPLEVIVIDTGSTDSTKEIALKYTDKVYDFEWIQDFSAARNYSISKASNDWILVLDSDEYVTSLDYEALIQFTKDYPDTIGRLLRSSPDYNGGITLDRVERFFNRKLYHYERPIHEQVVKLDQSKILLMDIPLTVDHSGYITPEIAKEKSERNLALLLQSAKENPNDPYTYFQIGQSYFMTQEFENAMPYFEKALSFDLDPDSEYVQMLIVSYGYCLNQMDRAADCITLYNDLYPYFKEYGDFVYTLGCAYIRTGEYIKAIQQFVTATTLKNYKTEGVTTYLSLYNLGLLYEQLGETKMALSFYENSLNYPPSKERYTLLKG